MSQRYLGGVITANPTTPTLTTESGVWTLEQQFQYSSVWSPKIIGNSVRLRASANPYLNRTPASATNRQTWTWSGWVKRGSLGATQFLFDAVTSSTTKSVLYFSGGDQLGYYDVTSGVVNSSVISSAVYRDVSAWYHVVFVIDTTQATSSNRVKIYVNGVQLTSFGTATYPSLNFNTLVNSTVVHNISLDTTAGASGAHFDGYLAEVNFIDGQALTPSSFGAFDTNGVWQPLLYTGTYGTNGFYLTFADNSAATATTLGKDYSGNGNNWTPNNISVTAGVTYDWMLDSPTNWIGAAGGNGVGNYAVLNAVSGYGGLPLTAANIQTSAVASGGNWYSRSATMGISSGKWYAEFSMPSITSGGQGNPVGVGIIPSSNDFSAAGQLVGDSSRGYGFYCPDTTGSAPIKRVSGSNTSVGTGSATATTDVFMVAFDLTNGNAWFGKNGTWYAGDPSAGTGASITGITASEYVFGVSVYRDNTYTNNTVAINFGQRPFAYTPPTGFLALNTQNLPAVNITNGAQYMAATLYTGNGATLSVNNAVNGVSFQPDFVWIKGRNAAWNNVLRDSVRGANQFLYSNTTGAEVTAGSGYSFDSNGFSIGASGEVNTNTNTYVGWQWRAGVSTVTNTAGTITSTVDAGTTQGFSIVTYTGTGVNATIGHGLGVAPAMVIVKRRNSTGDWPVQHRSVSASNVVWLNLANAQTASSTFQQTSPTSTVFYIDGGNTNVGANGSTYVAYCFAQVAGFSAFGSYTGNGSNDGPFVYTGFRPRFILTKNITTSGYWWEMVDSSREPFNPSDQTLYANVSDSEYTSSTYNKDLLSNGFKMRGTSAGQNSSGDVFIYMAFAENPFNIARAR